MHFRNEDALSCHQACRHFPEDRHGRLPLPWDPSLPDQYDEHGHILSVHVQLRRLLLRLQEYPWLLCEQP